MRPRFRVESNTHEILRVVVHAQDHDGKWLRACEIVERAEGITVDTVYPVLARMVRRGVLGQTHPSREKKFTTYYATPAGREVLVELNARKAAQEKEAAP